jgi:hypothetical protein
MPIALTSSSTERVDTLHQAIRREPDHLAQQIGIRTLLQKRLKSYTTRRDTSQSAACNVTEPINGAAAPA